MAEAEQRITALMAMERDLIYTQNDHYMLTSKRCFEDMLIKQPYGNGAASRAGNTECANGESEVYNVSEALAYLASAGIGLTAEDLDIAVARKKQKTAEHDCGLLELIAGTLAYFKVRPLTHCQAASSKNVRTFCLISDLSKLAMTCRCAARASGIRTGRPVHVPLCDKDCVLTPLDLTWHPSQVSSKRVVDGVPMHLHHYLLQRFCKQLNDLPAELAAGMTGFGEDAATEAGSGAEEGGVKKGQAVVLDAAKLMAEGESTAERRAQLNRQLKQLQGVKRILNVF